MNKTDSVTVCVTLFVEEDLWNAEGKERLSVRPSQQSFRHVDLLMTQLIPCLSDLRVPVTLLLASGKEVEDYLFKFMALRKMPANLYLGHHPHVEERIMTDEGKGKKVFDAKVATQVLEEYTIKFQSYLNRKPTVVGFGSGFFSLETAAAAAQIGYRVDVSFAPPRFCLKRYPMSPFKLSQIFDVLPSLRKSHTNCQFLSNLEKDIIILSICTLYGGTWLNPVVGKRRLLGEALRKASEICEQGGKPLLHLSPHSHSFFGWGQSLSDRLGFWKSYPRLLTKRVKSFLRIIQDISLNPCYKIIPLEDIEEYYDESYFMRITDKVWWLDLEGTENLNMQRLEL